MTDPGRTPSHFTETFANLAQVTARIQALEAQLGYPPPGLVRPLPAVPRYPHGPAQLASAVQHLEGSAAQASHSTPRGRGDQAPGRAFESSRFARYLDRGGFGGTSRNNTGAGSAGPKVDKPATITRKGRAVIYIPTRYFEENKIVLRGNNFKALLNVCQARQLIAMPYFGWANEPIEIQTIVLESFASNGVSLVGSLFSWCERDDFSHVLMRAGQSSAIWGKAVHDLSVRAEYAWIVSDSTTGDSSFAEAWKLEVERLENEENNGSDDSDKDEPSTPPPSSAATRKCDACGQKMASHLYTAHLGACTSRNPARQGSRSLPVDLTDSPIDKRPVIKEEPTSPQTYMSTDTEEHESAEDQLLSAGNYPPLKAYVNSEDFGMDDIESLPPLDLSALAKKSKNLRPRGQMTNSQQGSSVIQPKSQAGPSGKRKGKAVAGPGHAKKSRAGSILSYLKAVY
ncbi:hypothetical protein TREMEDRAFT_65328 [Tremella mesenterica DSM 1558]|uniref:uncharacterized protein n=1 Tax=Tremella mesenterica (strain ATCC 24925 / CBS 8224 / DSM 1558 / NBRC 9311 / NRRL Y-6157 / RJB 2259-6 / UBC 559-6) TaxID=578456 RepID=UPI00032C7E4D|nr:uncharacterized protein TREMEDRAFT_65328 [Tremella mesenterica DSM 1558]EIW66466.1 hypothetical protein TREMEDRAFT_65328 [Tremella mesenterica DSM 1558]